MISRFVIILAVLAAASTRADEGMWLFNQPPLKRIS